MPSQPQQPVIAVRLDVTLRDALDRLAVDTGLSRAAIVRAGLRAVIADPELLLGSARASGQGTGGSPAPRAKKRNGRRR